MGRPADVPDASSRRILFGTDEALPALLELRAGPLALVLREGELHDLRWEGCAAWHAVTFPHRDADWWTPPFAVEEVAREPRDGGFRLEVRGAFATVPRLRTRLVVEGDAQGRLRIAAEAVADADLATNRTGLCLLLPTTAAGEPCEVEHDDGRMTRSTIPTLVPPWPPFMGIREFRHRIAPGCWAHCAFAGDSFEFEDQRNNADASFKIYSRSNMMPRPYLLRAGVPVRQSLELFVEGVPSPARVRSAPAAPVSLRMLPRLGLAIAPTGGDEDLIRRALAILRPGFVHMSLDVDDLPKLRSDVPGLENGLPLHVELTVRDRTVSDADLVPLRALRPEAVAAFPSLPGTVEALRRAAPEAATGGGTPHFFAQINRIEDLGPVDFLTFTVSPLVHGAADDEVMACSRSIPGLVATLERRWPGRPVHLGPSAIAMRASPLGQLPPADGRSRRAMACDDPRSRGLFGAAWVLALVASCAEAGVAALTLMAAEGPSGVVERRSDGLLWHPASAVLARLGSPAEIVPAPVIPAPRLAALAVRRGGSRELLLANLGPHPVTAELEGWAADATQFVLDEAALRGSAIGAGPPPFAERRGGRRFTLGPYAVASCRDEAPLPEEVFA